MLQKYSIYILKDGNIALFCQIEVQLYKELTRRQFTLPLITMLVMWVKIDLVVLLLQAFKDFMISIVGGL